MGAIGFKFEAENNFSAEGAEQPREDCEIQESWLSPGCNPSNNVNFRQAL